MLDKNMHPSHPVAILIRGLPGSGKTYLAKTLGNEIGEDKVVLLDPDAIDTKSQEYLEHTKSLAAEGVDEKLHLYRFSRAKAYHGIEEDKIIIWNQPFTNLEIFNKMVGRLRDHAEKHHKKLPILVVEVEIDHALAKRRLLERKNTGGHGPSDETWSRFINDYKSFATEGYNTVTVYGSDDVSLSVSKVLKALSKLPGK